MLDSVGSEQKLSDTGLIEVIARCYRQAKQSGNTAIVKIAVKELVRSIDSIDVRAGRHQNNKKINPKIPIFVTVRIITQIRKVMQF